MPLVPANFPDLVWGRLKAWAKVQAATAASTNIEDCAAFVRHAAEAIAGPRALRPEVVEFYAAETLSMIERFREPRADAGQEQAV